MNQLIPDELATAAAERQAILFGGAGLSMSVGLPSWQQLVTHMREELGLPADEAPDPLKFSQPRGILPHRAGQYRAIAQLDGPQLEGLGGRGSRIADA